MPVYLRSQGWGLTSHHPVKDTLGHLSILVLSLQARGHKSHRISSWPHLLLCPPGFFFSAGQPGPSAPPPRQRQASLCSSVFVTCVCGALVDLSFLRWALPGTLLCHLLKRRSRSAWVAQSVERMTSAQIMISWFVSLSPVSGSVLTAQPGACFRFCVSLSLFAPPSPTLCLCLSLSKMNKR